MVGVMIDTIANIEGVEATRYDDIIVGTSGNNSLDGRGGNNQHRWWWWF